MADRLKPFLTIQNAIRRWRFRRGGAAFIAALLGIGVLSLFLSRQPDSKSSSSETILDNAEGQVPSFGRTHVPAPPGRLDLSDRQALKILRVPLKEVVLSPSLRAIQLNGDTYNDDDLRVLASIPTLEEVALWETKVTPKGLESLRTLKSLRVLWLAGSNATPDFVPSIEQLESLKMLKLAGTKFEVPNRWRGIEVVYYSY